MDHKVMDLNADVGEGLEDGPLFALISSANIACGGHAGDERTMEAALRTARSLDVRVGAHPGYEDREGFGRTTVALSPEALEALVRRQVERLLRQAARLGVRVRHVKPHGALYHDAGRSPELAQAFVRAVKALDPQLAVVAAPRSALLQEAEALGLTALAEGFADRRYRDDGTLVPRGVPGAVIDEPTLAASQAVSLACAQTVRTLCIHGDNPEALHIAQAVRRGLEDAGFRIQAPNG